MTTGAERTCKPGSVAPTCRSRRGRATISLEQRLPTASSSRPGRRCWTSRPTPARRLNFSLLGLAPDGVYRARPVTQPAGELLPHRFTLTARCPGGGFLSVALSLTSRPVGVTHHRALWSPDFPPLDSAAFSSGKTQNPHGGRPIRSASAVVSILPFARIKTGLLPLTPTTDSWKLPGAGGIVSRRQGTFFRTREKDLGGQAEACPIRFAP